MKKSLKTLLTLGIAAISAGTLASCGMDPVTTRFEAEDAEFITVESENPQAQSITVEAAAEGDEISNGFSVGYFTTAEESLKFKITSDREAKAVEAKFALASAAMNIKENSAGSKMATFTLGDQYKLTVNGQEIDLSKVVITPKEEEGMNYKDYSEYTITFDLKKGENVILFTKIEGEQLEAEEGYSSAMGNGVNVDYLEITAAANLTWEKTAGNYEVKTEDAE